MTEQRDSKIPAPAPSAGETRAAIIEECAKVAEDADVDCGRLEIASAIRALASIKQEQT